MLYITGTATTLPCMFLLFNGCFYFLLNHLCDDISHACIHYATCVIQIAGSDSDSEPGSPLHDSPSAAEAAATPATALAAVSAAAPAAQQDAPGARSVRREDWMTKSFPKAAAKADDVALLGAEPDGKKVCLPKCALAPYCNP